MQAPATIAEAFGDVKLASQIAERMQERVFADMRPWLDRGSNSIMSRSTPRAPSSGRTISRSNCWPG